MPSQMPRNGAGEVNWLATDSDSCHTRIGRIVLLRSIAAVSYNCGMSQPLVYLTVHSCRSPSRLAPNDAGFIWAPLSPICAARSGISRSAWRITCARFREAAARWPTCRSRSPMPSWPRRPHHRLVEHNSEDLGDDQDLALVILATPGPVGYYRAKRVVSAILRPRSACTRFRCRWSATGASSMRESTLLTPTIRQLPPGAIPPTIKQCAAGCTGGWRSRRSTPSTRTPAPCSSMDTGHVTETASANLLIVRDGQILTPPRGTVLNGISLPRRGPNSAASWTSPSLEILTSTSWRLPPCKRGDAVRALHRDRAPSPSERAELCLSPGPVSRAAARRLEQQGRTGHPGADSAITCASQFVRCAGRLPAPCSYLINPSSAGRAYSSGPFAFLICDPPPRWSETR